MKSDVARLCLGTAQFGSHYGITNTSGQPSREEIDAIISLASEAGIRFIDTAVNYGIRLRLLRDWNIITKVKAADIDLGDHLVYVEPWAILSHEPAAEHLVRAIKAAGYKGKIGQSAYHHDFVGTWCDVLQFPLSLADRRMLPLRDFLKPDLVTFARSIFLQGKLLEMGYSVSDCLGYVLRQPVDYAIVGVNSVKELEEIIRAAEALPEHVPEIIGPTLTADELDPRSWNSTATATTQGR